MRMRFIAHSLNRRELLFGDFFFVLTKKCLTTDNDYHYKKNTPTEVQLLKKTNFLNVQIQICKCGGIHMCFGNVTIHMDKREFMQMATQVEKTKKYLNNPIPQEVIEVSREIH